QGIHGGKEKVGIVIGFGVGYAVNAVIVVFAAGTRDRERLVGPVAAEPCGGRPGASTAIDVKGCTNIWAQADQLQEVAPVERKIDNALVVDHGSYIGILCVEQGRSAGHLNRFRNAANLKLEVDAGRLLNLQRNASPDLSLKALHFRSHVV